ncbi:AAA family ATPase [Candidatus Roizmanbacteria bacterium CG22_combo_CG10-13_8_21_14_all_38_20]|uniref:AAA family ATPase n=1 Tax=Candidatus Roizmanbacteria bacterium CG22_combo_CG10-13_8_21_14_all_38_20 TaxID=1974862 RepID=A0A2H0BVU8_9BACT|nr:MAG: AAA family ATPase [Candidatus Roizmanbacteria bacterium CG22_combo_CG10-13_8_21_14_all_38_20]PJC31374.1 MAG: AAA family ATPase [Candidatus Roizmanbacteria bacterium CG_4_9_14_0_2_um_filter_38_17]
MNKKTRYLTESIKRDLKNRMVFLGGPRQVGKTTLSKEFANTYYPGNSIYLNWDERDDRKRIINYEIIGEEKLVILDEIHKMDGWKNWIKGLYDKYNTTHKFIVTGSARLDIKIKGGDSLFGRYHYHVLHPLTLTEIVGQNKPPELMSPLKFSTDKTQEYLQKLLNQGGFPEPYTAKSQIYWKRWNKERIQRVLKDDILSIKDINKLGKSELMLDLLPTKIGSLFSANSVAQDLQISPVTVASWLETYINFYYIFQIRTYATKKVTTLRKATKLYLWDWAGGINEGVRYENLIASHLYKLVDYINNTSGEVASLSYLRDRESREVDFAVTVNDKIWFVVEAKLKHKGIASNLRYFVERENIPQAYQVVLEPGVDYKKDNIRVISAERFLTALI